jgi:hypothetical protein
MGALQIDTIHVVARSPYFVLWSRLGEYDPAWLDELLAEGALYEYWAHAACFLPVEWYPVSRALMRARLAGWRSSGDWLAEHAESAARLLDRIRTRGPVRSADFPREDGRAGTWWDWKPEKQALEHLHNTGVLMIARRERFQRVYDLRERVLPGWDDAATPELEAALRRVTLATVRALGVASDAWVPDYFRIPVAGTAGRLEALADEGLLRRVTVAGWQGSAYLHPEHDEAAALAAAGRLRPTLTTVLSPFDPVVWDRRRARALFGFDYTIECYTPAAKRRYGYFTLPLLHRGALVGRLDAKAHRREGRFELKALHLEDGVAPDEELAEALAGALRLCAAWHGTPRLELGQTDPPTLAPLLRPLLNP